MFRYGAGKAFSVKGLSDRAVFYSGLNLNQYGVASPCRTICTVCGFVALSSTALPRLAVLFVLSAASSPCPDLNLIHYT
nr:hypothetical protein [Neisseria meningitidis]